MLRNILGFHQVIVQALASYREDSLLDSWNFLDVEQSFVCGSSTTVFLL